jgi:6-phosphogluconolactonase (cycloisomerase 2 family)
LPLKRLKKETCFCYSDFNRIVFHSSYHSRIAGHRNAKTDASFYDIREFFQGRSATGTMKQKSNDAHYNALIKDLRQKLTVLAETIKPKVYEYGFLLE